MRCEANMFSEDEEELLRILKKQGRGESLGFEEGWLALDEEA